MYWNRKLDSLLPSILITQNERNSAEAVILPARPCVTRTKLAEQPVIFVMWGHFSALTPRTLAGSPNSAVSSCSSHLPVLSHLKSKLSTHWGLFLSKDRTTCKNKSFFCGLAPKERHSGFHLRTARPTHLQMPVREEALQETPSPREADGILFSHRFQWGQNRHPAPSAARGGDGSATAPRAGCHLLALLR